MAKINKTGRPKTIEETLWQSCEKLRGSVEPSEYKHVVLGLFFLKFASDKFEQRKNELIAKREEKHIDIKEFYTKKNVSYLDEVSRWSYILKNAGQNDISLKIDSAFRTIEKNNPALKNALPNNYFSRLELERTKLSSLLKTIDKIEMSNSKGQDLIGRVYEYFLGKFALKESRGKGKGEFYTPKNIVNLICELIEPYKGIIYDPCCGTGGMFVQSVKFLEKHRGNQERVSIYGQENTPTTYKLAKMNMAIHGISANLGKKHADTFSNDQHKNLKADYIMANPPFNLKDWRGENELQNDPRWKGYEVPPKSNANYGWILNMASKLSDNGVAAFILANGALSGKGEEYKIRRKLIENDLVEAIIIIPRNTFYTTDISVTLWILNKNKKKRTDLSSTPIGIAKNFRDRTGEILFMDLRSWGGEYEKGYIELTEKDIQLVAETYHNWQQTEFESTYNNVPEFCMSACFKDLQNNDFSLIPSKYIEFRDKDNDTNFDIEMKRIQHNLINLLQKEKKSQEQLMNAFKSLGYEL